MSDGKLMGDLALTGSAPEMRVVDQGGAGIAVLCAGDSPRVWFGSQDEVAFWTWLNNRGPLAIPSMSWADLQVSDSPEGITFRTTDGVELRVDDASARALCEWLRIKLGPRARNKVEVSGEAAADGPPAIDVVYGGEIDGRAAMPAIPPFKPFVLDSGILLQDDTELGVSFRKPGNCDCICFFNHLGEIELMKYIEYVLDNPSPHDPRKFGELTVRPVEPGGLDVIAYDGRELVHLPEGQLRDIKAWLERKLVPEEAGKTSSAATADACRPDDMLEREHGGQLMRVRDLPAQYDDLKSWIGAKYGTHNILAVLSSDHLRLRWYTRDSLISVSVRLPGQNGSARGYLGATASSRAPRPGETWTRGNDLADGPYSHETWLKIVADAAFWDVLPLRIPMTLENDARNQSGYPADHPYVIPVRPEIPNGDKAPIKLSPRDEALDVVRAAVNVPADMMLDEVVGGVVDAAYVKHAQVHADKLPAGVDPRVITDTPFFSMVDPITYQAAVDIGHDTFSVSMVCTPKFESTVDGVRGMDMRAAIDKAVGDYVAELVNLNKLGASDGATRPLIKLVVEAQGIWWMVYGFNLKKMIPKSGVE